MKAIVGILLVLAATAVAGQADVVKNDKCIVGLCKGLTYCNDPTSCLTDFKQTKLVTSSGSIRFECHVQLPPGCAPPDSAMVLSDFKCKITPPPESIPAGGVVTIASHATVTPSGNVNYHCDYKP